MVNKSSKVHGLVGMNMSRPKGKMWKRRNKAKARARSETLHAELKKELAKISE